MIRVIIYRYWNNLFSIRLELLLLLFFFGLKGYLFWGLEVLVVLIFIYGDNNVFIKLF